MKGRCCSVCLSANRDAVDSALLSGATLIPTAKQYGLSKSALSRHKSACLAPRAAAAARAVSSQATVKSATARAKAIAAGDAQPTFEELASLKGLVGSLGRSLGRLEAAAEAAAGDRAYGALAALSAQIHRGLETAGKLQGLYADGIEPASAPRFTINMVIGGVRGSRQVRHAGEPEVGSAEPGLRIKFLDPAPASSVHDQADRSTINGIAG